MSRQQLIEPGRLMRLEAGTAQSTSYLIVVPADGTFEPPPVRPMRLRVVSAIEGDAPGAAGGVIATLRIRCLGGPSHELHLRGGTETFEIDARPQLQEWEAQTAFMSGGPAVLIHDLALEPLPEPTDREGG